MFVGFLFKSKEEILIWHFEVDRGEGISWGGGLLNETVLS